MGDTYTLVLLEDWIAVYKNGELIAQDHSIDESGMLKLVGIDHEIVNGHMDDKVRDYVYENDVPDNLSDLPRS